jgi:arsenite methyltransferase
MRAREPDYGIDVPWLVVAGFGGAVVGAVWLIAVASTALTTEFPGGLAGRAVASLFLVLGLGASSWILWVSRRAKFVDRDRLLAALPWRGDERLLDVGCGRGLLVVGALRKIPHGRAVGLDLFQSRYESGNRPDATMQNARLEGVHDRLRLLVADARRLPLRSEAFDLVVTRAALINLVDLTFPGSRWSPREGHGYVVNTR